MKPILFNTDMVRAILNNRKTVTRRVVKPQPISKLAYVCMGHKHGTWGYPDKDAWKYWDDESFRLPDGLPEPEREKRWTPPCHTGDILYVRETWAVWSPTYGTIPEIIYKADGYSQSHKMKWHPSIYMPMEAARIFLRVTDVRVERLQQITDDGARAEGVQSKKPEWEKIEFADLWNSTIKPKDFSSYGWDANPWVWVIEFEQCEKPEGDGENV